MRVVDYYLFRFQVFNKKLRRGVNYLEEEGEDSGEDGETSDGEGGGSRSGCGGGVSSGSGGRRVGGEGVSALSLELEDCRSSKNGGIRDGLSGGEDDVTRKGARIRIQSSKQREN